MVEVTMNSRIAVIFPGQGSQSVGMLADIADQFSEIQASYAEASDVLGYDLWKLCQVGPSVELDKTVHTQPALLAGSYAIWCILSKAGIKPAVMAGHSLGEYSALVCAGALSFKDGIRLVAARGQFMQEATPAGVGGLAAIVGLDDAAVAALCKQAALAGEVLEPANFNCPGQVVIAGHMQAVQRALVLAKEAGAKLAKLLTVSVPSHCALMKPAAERLSALLETITISVPSIPIINNVNVEVDTTETGIRNALVKQLYMPVRWVESVYKIDSFGVDQIIECGPGKVLTGLVKRMAPNTQLTNTFDLANLQAVLTSLAEHKHTH
jgi:[acyl-carrier-protein] S-malonyltransferase